MNEIRLRLHQAEAGLTYSLERFGDKLSAEQGYDNIDGIEAVRLYLIRTYHWTPSYVKSMAAEDMRFVLNVEMKGFTFRD
ncbi:hypothetical protein IBL26_11780 [Roseomonas aerophila]|uniref:Uncharacterized protein n=2 Tax=Teichococcus aerophilus TaxID=1224513 RepID=A0ABR7RLP6_9PROT|nr:hypothetical protein [Pseudoroseomonas aerophila]